MRGAGRGSSMACTNSPASRAPCGPARARSASTATLRSPPGPAISTRARLATSAGTESAAGEALHRLPPRLARPCTCVEPIRPAASSRPGHSARNSSLAVSSQQRVAAPMRTACGANSTPSSPGMRFRSTSVAGERAAARICTSRSVPPANAAAPACGSSSATASATDSGAQYRCTVMQFLPWRRASCWRRSIAARLRKTNRRPAGGSVLTNALTPCAGANCGEIASLPAGEPARPCSRISAL